MRNVNRNGNVNNNNADNTNGARLDTYKNVFDSQTLIQISGRVGRKKEFPNGEIIFLSYKKTKDMENAIKTIIEENNIRE